MTHFLEELSHSCRDSDHLVPKQLRWLADQAGPVGIRFDELAQHVPTEGILTERFTRNRRVQAQQLEQCELRAEQALWVTGTSE